MNTKAGLVFAGVVCSGFAVLAFGQNAAPVAERSTSAAPTEKAPASLPATDSAPLTRAEAQEKIVAAQHYVAHPPAPQGGGPVQPQVKTPDFEMATPPPTPRAETQPAAPSSGLVWVAGHHMPVEGKWRWVRGEWAVPALPISVWIPARYDEKTKKWSPGYWQPDRVAVPEAEPEKKSGAPARSSGY